MPEAVLIKLLEIILPPLLQLLVNRLSKKEQTPEVQQKIQAHQAAIAAIRPSQQVKV
jgi:hypothetical protein